MKNETKRGGQFTDADGLVEYLPTNTLFLISAGLILLTFIPFCLAVKHRKSAKTAAKEVK